MKKNWTYRILVLVMSALLLACSKEETALDCPEIELITIKGEIRTGELSQTPYLFYAQSKGTNEKTAVEWYLDGIKSPNDDTSDPLIFGPEMFTGEHEICFKTLPTENCTTVIEKCTTVAILLTNNLCDNLFFTSNQLTQNGLIYEFSANFKGREAIDYDWSIDGVAIEAELIDNSNRDHQFTYTFDPSKSEYKICIEPRDSSCDNSYDRSYCETIKTPKYFCDNIGFRYQKVGDSPTEFLFEANFENKEKIDYSWYINDQRIESEIVGDPTTDHILRYNFGPVNNTFLVCIRSETPSCAEVTQACEGVYATEFFYCPYTYSRENTWEFVPLPEQGPDRYLVVAYFPESFSGNSYWYINDQFRIPANDDANGPVATYTVEVTLNKNQWNFIEFYFETDKCPQNARISADYFAE